MEQKIISISGLIGSGKNTVANLICELSPNLNFQRISFAARLKDTIATLFHYDRDLLEGSSVLSREWRETQDSYWYNKSNGKIKSPRWILQQFGVEIKKLFCEDFWASIVENEILNHLNQNFILTDTRFPDEIEMLKKHNTFFIEVKRGVQPSWYTLAEDYNTGILMKKPEILNSIPESEWRWIGKVKYHTIYNNGSLDDLKKTVFKTLLEKEIIINGN